MMRLIGNALLGGRGNAFMLIEAATVFIALVGTTLACINTGARVTYAMGRDKEVPEHFRCLHGDEADRRTARFGRSRRFRPCSARMAPSTASACWG